ncbi:hypothetical protein P4V64_21710, partial [Bacillus thuringiensis]|nr:hypothetical protein [Bacillus thuringiensis]
VNGDSGNSNNSIPPKGKPDTTKKNDPQGNNKPDTKGTGKVVRMTVRLICMMKLEIILEEEHKQSWTIWHTIQLMQVRQGRLILIKENMRQGLG